MKQRLNWVDYAKGVGIILVVFAHNLGGERSSGISLPGVLAAVISYAYSFHMPLFFFLSGLFATYSYRKGFLSFSQSKLRTILYPFVVWSLILGTIQVKMAAYVNHPLPGGHSPLFFLILPVEQMWFLQALFFMYLFFALAQKLAVGPRRFFFISAVLTLIVAPLIRDETVKKILFHFIFFGAGVCLHSGVNVRLLGTKTGPMLAIFLAALCVQLFLIFGLPSVPVSYVSEAFVRVVMAFLGIASISAISEVFNRFHAMQWLRVVGQYSMPIFLMHTIFGSGTRIVLIRFLHLYNPYLHAGLELAAGVGIPMIIAFALSRRNTPWVFEWPAPRLLEATR